MPSCQFMVNFQDATPRCPPPHHLINPPFPVIHSCDRGWERRQRSTEKWNRESLSRGLEGSAQHPPKDSLEIFYGDIYQFQSKDTVYKHFLSCGSKQHFHALLSQSVMTGRLTHTGRGGRWQQRRPPGGPPQHTHRHTHSHMDTHIHTLDYRVCHKSNRMRRHQGKSRVGGWGEGGKAVELQKSGTGYRSKSNIKSKAHTSPISSI